MARRGSEGAGLVSGKVAKTDKHEGVSRAQKHCPAWRAERVVSIIAYRLGGVADATQVYHPLTAGRAARHA